MYYLVRVKVANDNGKRIKWQKEAYLVSAVSVTDAEACTTMEMTEGGVDFEVVEVKKSDICKVL